MGGLLRTLARTGFRRGLAGPGGRGWLAVGLAAGVIQFLRRKADEPKVSYSEQLEPGQSIVITHFAKGEAP
ncbi:MAG: hypothetical protein LC733_12865 [Actinobacteria bacterium]|nr:hypothetical protein [Actinomycetota bacterium]